MNTEHFPALSKKSTSNVSTQRRSASRCVPSFVAVLLILLAACNPTPDELAEPRAASPTPTIGVRSDLAPGKADAKSDSTDRALYEKLMRTALARSLDQEKLGTIIQEVGSEFLGAQYVAGMLDEGERERLVISLSRFDCVLFVETVLAASQAIAVRDTTFEGFAARIRNLRYRDGTLDGYCSRLHYFSDWIADNEKRNVVDNLTESIGGVRMKESPDFMSTHRNLYPRFAENDSLFRGVLKMEEDLRAVPILYVPQGAIRSVYPKLQAGDIIATATDVPGLDVSHTGFAFDNGDGTFGFLHASTTDGVKISRDLSDYVLGNRKQTGIIVVRPIDGR